MGKGTHKKIGILILKYILAQSRKLSPKIIYVKERIHQKKLYEYVYDYQKIVSIETTHTLLKNAQFFLTLLNF